VSIEYEDLTMRYGCLSCLHEWLSNLTNNVPLIKCPNCESETIYEELNGNMGSHSEKKCSAKYYPDDSVKPDFSDK